MATLQDRRRVLGPADLVPLEWPKKQDAEESTQEEAVSSSILPSYLKQHVVGNASGSSYLELGSIKLQCMVNGPLPIRGSFTESAEFVVETKVSAVTQTDDIRSAVEKRLSSTIRAALLPSILLEKYPKSQINLVVVLLSGLSKETENSVAASAINAASIALADAGILLKDLVSATSFSICEKTHTPNFALTATSSSSSASCLAAYLAATETITGFWCQGSINEDLLEHINRISLDGAKEVRKYLNGALLHHFIETSQEKQQ